MKEVLQWFADNPEIVKLILGIIASAGAYLYAAIIHHKSSVKLNALQAKEDIQKELIEELEELKKALKEGQNE